MIVRRLCSIAMLSAACGGRLQDDPSANMAPAPTAVFVADSRSCAVERTIGDTGALRARDLGDGLAVVEVASSDECTGAGGHYLLAREVGGSRRFWIGAHGCRAPETAPPPQAITHGVVRYAVRAGLDHIDGSLCVGFPDERNRRDLSTDTRALGIATFSSLEDAEAHAVSLGWKRR